jgi:hypothetical protein
MAKMKVDWGDLIYMGKFFKRLCQYQFGSEMEIIVKKRLLTTASELQGMRFCLDSPSEGNISVKKGDRLKISGWLLADDREAQIVVRNGMDNTIIDLSIARQDVVNKLLKDTARKNEKLMCGFQHEFLIDEVDETILVGIKQKNESVIWVEELKICDNDQTRQEFSIVTVAYKAELEMLKLQLRSMSKFLNINSIDNILIVWNENISTIDVRNKYLDEFKKALDFFEKKSHLLTLISAVDVVDPNILALPGWKTQQIIKIKVSDILKSGSYCVLDAKNIILRNVDVNTFITSENLMQTIQVDYTGHGEFRKYYENGLRLFKNIMYDPDIKFALPTVTPVVLSKKHCQEMNSYLIKHYGKSFEYYILESKEDESTEFLLYAAYIKANKLTNISYKFSDSLKCITFFSVSPNTKEKFDAYLKELLSNEKVNFMGIHLKRYAKLSDGDRLAISQFWVKVGLFTKQEQALEYFKLV